MKKDELIDLLHQVAAEDLNEGADIFDHPCTVAVRAINQCFEDVATLKRLCKRGPSQSKRVQMLLGLSYNPEW